MYGERTNDQSTKLLKGVASRQCKKRTDHSLGETSKVQKRTICRPIEKGRTGRFVGGCFWLVGKEDISLAPSRPG